MKSLSSQIKVLIFISLYLTFLIALIKDEQDEVPEDIEYHRAYVRLAIDLVKIR